MAGLVGRTVDWLSRAENNRMELDRLSVIKTLADALDVSLGDLLAEPTLMEWTADSGSRTVPALRSALMNYRQLTPLLGVPTEGDPTPLDKLRTSVVEIMDAYQASRYGFATRRLPLVLADALIAARSYGGREREQVNELLALTYQSAAMVLWKVGEVDLAWIAGELAPEAVEGMRPQAEELKSVAFVAPSEIADRTIPRLARRILAAIDARAASAPVYLEHGQAQRDVAA
ncbi:hypothetical protein OHV08_31070 [Streptomyces canus]|uniref:hypothetical protein n=1 Tax=Streptomyces canus TaxID=58343 RepID=UPI0032505777